MRLLFRDRGWGLGNLQFTKSNDECVLLTTAARVTEQPSSRCPDCQAEMVFVRPVPRGLITRCDRDAAQIGSGIFRCPAHGEYRIYTTGRVERLVARLATDRLGID